jgi:hypothetical protein
MITDNLRNIIADHKWKNEGIELTKDGNQWLAVYSDFINLVESLSGWGDTQEEAVLDLKKASTLRDKRKAP